MIHNSKIYLIYNKELFNKIEKWICYKLKKNNKCKINKMINHKKFKKIRQYKIMHKQKIETFQNKEDQI